MPDCAHLGDEQGREEEAREGECGQDGPAGALDGLEQLPERERLGDLVDGVPERAYAGGGLDLLAEAGVVPHVGVEVGLGALLAEPGFLLDLGGLELVRLVQQAHLVRGEEGQHEPARHGRQGVEEGAHVGLRGWLVAF